MASRQAQFPALLPQLLTATLNSCRHDFGSAGVRILPALRNAHIAQSWLFSVPQRAVRDGDTIEINRTAIRLNRLHAPELDEPLGPDAKAAMVGHVQGKIVTCSLNGKKTHDRLVGNYYLDGEDIAAWLVSQGLGRDCPHFSGGRYKELERELGASLSLPDYCL